MRKQAFRDAVQAATIPLPQPGTVLSQGLPPQVCVGMCVCTFVCEHTCRIGCVIVHACMRIGCVIVHACMRIGCVIVHACMRIGCVYECVCVCARSYLSTRVGLGV